MYLHCFYNNISGVVECEWNLAGLQVGGMLHGVGIIAVVSLFDDRVQQICKHLKHTVEL